MTYWHVELDNSTVEQFTGLLSGSVSHFLKGILGFENGEICSGEIFTRLESVSA